MRVSLFERTRTVNRRIEKARQDLNQALPQPQARRRARTNPLQAVKTERYAVKQGEAI